LSLGRDRDGRRLAIAFPPLDARQVNAVQQHGEVGGADLDTMVTLACGRRKLEAPFFEPLEARITLPSF